MILAHRYRFPHLGDDGSDADLTDLTTSSSIFDNFDLGTLTTATSAGISPLWMAGLGLIGLAVVLSFGQKQVRKVRTKMRKRARRKQQISALEAQLKQLRAS